MSTRKTKTSGWAAFDPNKKPQKEVTETHNHNDPYPPISTNITSTNLHPTCKSFSSVLTPVPTKDTHNPLTENNVTRLKELHPWANHTLIADILAAVDNHIHNALNLLRQMAPPAPTSFNEKKKSELDDVNLSVKNDQLLHSGNMFPNHNDLSMIPMEPEWEEDDMYLIHRKHAIRAMRLASRHSKAASEAYLRNDHAAAQEFSQKAREEWSNAEKLNTNAAKEILAIRNSENDDWKLDLHGLHAAEAVQVLLEHLLKIESQVSGTHSSKPDKNKGSVNQETDKSDRQPHLLRPRLLEVITGKGSHSRGEAALPVAIKSFLSEKGYYYYEARIGVITVQPKFRQLSRQLTPALSNA